MPLFDPDYCENRCPVCTRARKGNRIAKILQNIEWAVTFGGCPWCRARQRKYGVPPDQPLPSPDDDPPQSPSPQADSPPTTERPAKLRWYQWRLRSLFVLTLLVAIGMSWLATTIQNQRKQSLFAIEIIKGGGGARTQPTWLGQTLHDDSLEAVTELIYTVESSDDPLLPQIRGLSQLQSLTLYGATDTELAYLRGLRQLTHLELVQAKVTDQGLKNLEGLSLVQELNLQGTKISDDALALLEKLPALQTLNLSWTGIGDGGLKRLKCLTAIQELSLRATLITDDGLRDIPTPPSLKSIDLELTRVTADGASKLQKSLPGCQVRCNAF
jgi:hypothetical protein